MAQLIVSISGIRGIIGDGLGPREAVRFGMALGTQLASANAQTGRVRACTHAEAGDPETACVQARTLHPKETRQVGDPPRKDGTPPRTAGTHPTVVMGRDSRPSGPMLTAALRAGLLGTGCHIVDVGILSTPGISLMVRHLGAAGGVIITASHNPPPYNGIKMLSPAGTALNRAAGQAVVELYTREAFTQVGTDGMAGVEVRDDGAEIHVRRVTELLQVEKIRACKFTVAVDAVNGAGGREMSMLLERLGCRVTMIHGEPTGHFGRGAEPIPEHLGDLGRAVREAHAVVGLALDPDADRLALVDETGRPLGEEYTLALAARHRLTQKSGPLAANLSTSRMMDDVAAEANVKLYRTPVGEVNVAEEILAKGCVIGGEGNGGVIDPRVTPVRDSLVGAGMILEMLATRRLHLGELAAELAAYTIVKDKIPLSAVPPAAVFAAVRSRFGGAGATVDERDGLHLALEDGWIHIRASNTEPILRVMAEAADEAKARGWVAEVKAMAAG